jgi:hypothetical protein
MADTKLLIVRADGHEIARVDDGQVPIELSPSFPLHDGAVIAFEDRAGGRHVHHLPDPSGWCHLSIRVHANLTCQADCVISESERSDPQAASRGGAIAYRFQPFFLAGADADPAALRGQGLFARGLHFSGFITPGNVRLSCECDVCRKSFVARSFHAGFSDAAYMYSGSGRHTILIDGMVDGAPVPLSAPDPGALAALERQLPTAPDGSPFRYLNPFRCPECGAAFIDFRAHPGLREREYYGLYLPDAKPMRYPA